MQTLVLVEHSSTSAKRIPVANRGLYSAFRGGAHYHVKRDSCEEGGEGLTNTHYLNAQCVRILSKK